MQQRGTLTQLWQPLTGDVQQRKASSKQFVPPHRSSPTMRMGCLGLKAILVSLAFLTIFCLQSGRCLSSDKS